MHAQTTQNNKFSILLQYLIKEVSEKVGFLPTDKCPSFHQSDILYHFRCVARHAQITQNNKFAISLQYFRKELSYKVDFLDADMHECFVQIDTRILMGAVKQSQISQNSLQRLYKISNKKIGM